MGWHDNGSERNVSPSQSAVDDDATDNAAQRVAYIYGGDVGGCSRFRFVASIRR